MQKPVQIHLPTTSSAAMQYHQRVPPTAQQRLRGASVQSWRSATFSVLEQYYDAKDVFICLAEIETKEDISISLTCHLPDLYWLYQLRGSYSIHTAADPHQEILHMPTGTYTQVYIPSGRYLTRYSPGKHTLFYFLIKPKWLLRHGKRELSGLETLLDSLQEKLSTAWHNPYLPLHDRITSCLLQLYTLPRMKKLAQEIRL